MSTNPRDENPYQSPVADTSPPTDFVRTTGPRVYWSAAFVPELAVLPKKERRRLWRRHAYKAFWHWQTWAALLLFVCCNGGSVYVFFSLFDVSELSSSARVWLSGLAGGIGSGIGGLLFSQVFTEMARPYLRNGLAEYPEALAKLE